jgi:hypothetical protein
LEEKNMADPVNPGAVYQSVYQTAHNWLDGTVASLTPEQAAWAPAGMALPAGAHLAHIITSEDLLVLGMAMGGAPLIFSSFVGRSGISEVPAPGDWSGWARRVEVDLPATIAYGKAVYDAVNAYLATLTAADLAKEVDLSAAGIGMMPLSYLVSNVLTNIAAHTGEIACLKGIQGAQGYPFSRISRAAVRTTAACARPVLEPTGGGGESFAEIMRSARTAPKRFNRSPF